MQNVNATSSLSQVRAKSMNTMGAKMVEANCKGALHMLIALVSIQVAYGIAYSTSVVVLKV